jgi:hypothetical protein
LLVAQSRFEVSPEGEVLPRPKAARLDILVSRGNGWEVVPLEDPESNVFHKAMVWQPRPARGRAGPPAIGPRAGGPGILTLGGSAAALKLWRPGSGEFVSETIWEEDFGGSFSRMRDAEAADLFGDGGSALAVATHDQGVVAVVRPGEGGGFEIIRLDERPETIVHEIEIGDLDGDGVPEVYATPSEKNRLDGTPQAGRVLRWVPARGEGPDPVADLGTRHAKEILVDDVDGDGRDELYVVVEAVEGGRVEIRRFDAGTDPAGGVPIARLEDRLCRFLTVGDLEGDGRREMVAAAHRSGLWVFRPGDSPEDPWSVRSIDRESSGFEHAALLADLDGDGRDELYVASDDQGEIRRYVARGDEFERETLLTREIPGSAITWNLMPVPVDLVP